MPNNLDLNLSIVLEDTLKDHNTKRTILCLFKPEIKKNNQSQVLRAGDHCQSANRKRLLNQSDSRISNFRFTLPRIRGITSAVKCRCIIN